MFQDQTETMLDQRGPGTGPGPELTLLLTSTPIQQQHNALYSLTDTSMTTRQW